MTLKSSTFAVQAGSSAKVDAKKKLLLKRHHNAVEKVLTEAKTFSEDRKRTLSEIADEALRQSATR